MKGKSVRNFLILFVLISIPFLQGCLKNDEAYDFNAALNRDNQTIDNYLSTNGLTAITDPVYGVRFFYEEEGEGIKAVNGDGVKMKYSVRLLDGTVIEENKTATFRKGAREVIDGLEIMMILMRTGDKVKAFVPSPYAYRDQQRGSIPPNSILVFDLEMTDISYGSYDFDGLMQMNQETIDLFLDSIGVEPNIDPRSGLRFVTTQIGSGNVPNLGDEIMVRYTGRVMNSNRTLAENPFDSNVGSGELFSFVFDYGSVIQGWDLGFRFLSPGSKATLYIPSPLAYRNQARSGIPANSILVFDVEFVRYNQQQ
ncbi:MAG: FKBP-type peptidyl-prolyl cis-trans isomerase [Cyclobacteriaceae bacterium]|nr:FKBP-type peptidyl-prolyl cis-trans isomerase [Cyclobacteriaceae bacterium]